MTGKQVPLLLLVSFVLVGPMDPARATDAGWTEGSERKPHVSDMQGNVRETADWPGMGLAPRPHMDVLAAWLEHLPNGQVQATIKVDNLTNMHYAAESWDLYYSIEAGIFEGDRQVCWFEVCYLLVLQANKAPGASTFEWNAWYSWPASPAVYPVVPKERLRAQEAIPVSGAVEIGAPGYIRFRFHVSDLEDHGDRLEGFHVESREYSYLAGAHTGWQVYNEASSDAAFAMAGWEHEETAGTPARDETGAGPAGPTSPRADAGAPAAWIKNLPQAVYRGEAVPAGSPPIYEWVTLVGLLGIAAALRARFALLAIAVLFTRISVDEALDHPRRGMLVELVRQNAGATFARLRAVAGMGSGALAYHLAVLERHGLIRRVSARGRRHYFLPGQTVGVQEMPPHRMAIRQALMVTPGGSAKEVAKRAGLTRTGALYHLRRLESAGQVRSVKQDGTRRFYVA